MDLSKWKLRRRLATTSMIRARGGLPYDLLVYSFRIFLERYPPSRLRLVAWIRCGVFWRAQNDTQNEYMLKIGTSERLASTFCFSMRQREVLAALQSRCSFGQTPWNPGSWLCLCYKGSYPICLWFPRYKEQQCVCSCCPYMTAPSLHTPRACWRSWART